MADKKETPLKHAEERSVKAEQEEIVEELTDNTPKKAVARSVTHADGGAPPEDESYVFRNVYEEVATQFYEAFKNV